MVAAAGKEHDLFVLVNGSLWPSSGRRALYYGYSDLGRMSLDLQMAHSAKRSMVESDS